VGSCAARNFFESKKFEAFVAVLICTNFVTNAYESEMNGRLVDEDGNPSGPSLHLCPTSFELL
jgi:hypothetical protein